MKIFKKKQIKIVLLIIVAITFSVWLFGFILLKYENFKEIQSQKEKIEQMEKTIKNDTYGGKTPEETLQMFIDAVEAGDYELASKYFTVEKRERELDTLQKTSQNNNIDFLLGYLYQTMNSGGYFSTDGKIYTIKNPVFIEFILYPSGIWKINEI